MGIERLPEIWPDWSIESLIGEGAFGKVYKAVRNDSSFTTYAAIKVITVPKSESEIESLQADGMSIVGAKAYLKGIVSDFINEIRLMEAMKGTSNIVSVEDYKVVEKKDGIGWDIFIRMELLSPLVKSLAGGVFSETDVIKLGIDICSALELCAKNNVVHRDIKPENIFVSSHGNYKIGDFGIAKQLEKTNTSLSTKGTFNYIAPEVAKGYKYDGRVDIYSLGIVLYKLLNNNRLPFIDPYKEQLSYEDKKLAVDRRLSGEVIPPPVRASKGMATIIGIACSYNPEDRFVSPTAMKNALTRLLAKSRDIPVVPVQSSTSLSVDNTGEQRRIDTASDRISQTGAPITGYPANNAVTGNFPRTVTHAPTSTTVNPHTKTGITTNVVDGGKNKSSGKGVILSIVLVAVIAIAIIVIACTALAAGNDTDDNKLTEPTEVSVITENYIEPDFSEIK